MKHKEVFTTEGLDNNITKLIKRIKRAKIKRTIVYICFLIPIICIPLVYQMGVLLLFIWYILTFLLSWWLFND